jgi:tetratricopeptide (TPR) repeat protein
MSSEQGIEGLWGMVMGAVTTLMSRRHLRTLLVAVAAGLMIFSVCTAGWWYYSSTQPEARLQRGRDALRRGDRAESERIVQLLLADGHSNHAHLLRGEAFFLQQQHARAIEELERMRDPGMPLRVEAALILGQCQVLQNQPEQAERAFRFVLFHRPDCLVARRCLTGIYYLQGASMRAVEQATEWAKLDERDGQPYLTMGHIHRDLGDAYLPDAIDDYREALHRDLPAAAVEEAREELAACLVRRLQWSEALSTLDAAPPLHATAERQALRVRCLWALDRANEARTLLDQGLADAPRSLELLLIGADIRQADKRHAEAATLLETAIEQDRHDPQMRHKLSLAYEALGRRADAAEQRRMAEKAKELLREMEKLRDQAASDPWNAAPRLRLAALSTELGREDWAKMWRDAAKACGPSFEN